MKGNEMIYANEKIQADRLQLDLSKFSVVGKCSDEYELMGYLSKSKISRIEEALVDILLLNCKIIRSNDIVHAIDQIARAYSLCDWGCQKRIRTATARAINDFNLEFCNKGEATESTSWNNGTQSLYGLLRLVGRFRVLEKNCYIRRIGWLRDEVFYCASYEDFVAGQKDIHYLLLRLLVSQSEYEYLGVVKNIANKYIAGCGLVRNPRYFIPSYRVFWQLSPKEAVKGYFFDLVGVCLQGHGSLKNELYRLVRAYPLLVREEIKRNFIKMKSAHPEQLLILHNNWPVKLDIQLFSNDIVVELEKLSGSSYIQREPQNDEFPLKEYGEKIYDNLLKKAEQLESEKYVDIDSGRTGCMGVR